MIDFVLPSGPLAVACLGAHPDDIEIGCGGTLLALAASRDLTVDYVVMTGSEDRHQEARTAAAKFMSGATITHHLHSLPDGRLPGYWDEVKQKLEDVAQACHPDLVFAPRTDDSHQDHRLIAELVSTVWRGVLVLHYEIPKWDGDLGQVTHFVALDEAIAGQKIALLNNCFPSQTARGWWGDETFSAMLRLRGIECNARYAEGFIANKTVINFGLTPS